MRKLRRAPHRQQSDRHAKDSGSHKLPNREGKLRRAPFKPVAEHHSADVTKAESQTKSKNVETSQSVFKAGEASQPYAYVQGRIQEWPPGRLPEIIRKKKGKPKRGT